VRKQKGTDHYAVKEFHKKLYWIETVKSWGIDYYSKYSKFFNAIIFCQPGRISHLSAVRIHCISPLIGRAFELVANFAHIQATNVPLS